MFQCSSASRKFLNNRVGSTTLRPYNRFSALQRAENSSIVTRRRDAQLRFGFSALQRAENSSIELEDGFRISRASFQCSSASRKFLNRIPTTQPKQSDAFQCSSASRKFLNGGVCVPSCVFAGFQCSSASRKFLNVVTDTQQLDNHVVSVLFSEPKIPQSYHRHHSRHHQDLVIYYFCTI